MTQVLERLRREDPEAGIFELAIDDGGNRCTLSVTARPDQPETLYLLSAVLFSYDWIIESAWITAVSGQIEDRFRIRPVAETPPIGQMREMLDDLERMFSAPASVLRFLNTKGKTIRYPCTGSATFSWQIRDGLVSLEIQMADQAGLALALSHFFALVELDLLEVRLAESAAGQIQDLFVFNPSESRLLDAKFRERITDALSILL